MADGLDDYSAFELVPDALHATVTRTEDEKRVEFVYTHPDLRDVSPAQRHAEEREIMTGEFDSFLGEPFSDADGAGEFIICDVNDHIALAVQTKVPPRNRLVDHAAHRFLSLQQRLRTAATARDVSVLIAEAKSLGQVDVTARAFCATYLAECFAKRASLLPSPPLPPSGGAGGTEEGEGNGPTRPLDPPAAGQEDEVTVTDRDLHRPVISGHVLTALGTAFVVDEDAASSLPPAAAGSGKQVRTAVWAANTHVSDTPKWTKTWLELVANSQLVLFDEQYVGAAEVLAAGNMVRFRVWKSHRLFCKRAQKPCMEYLVKMAHAPKSGAKGAAFGQLVGAAFAITSGGSALCTAVFDTNVVVAGAFTQRANTLAAVLLQLSPPLAPPSGGPKEGVRCTCAMFADRRLLRIGTSQGTVYTVAWMTAAVVHQQDVPDVSPIIAMRAVGDCRNYVSRTVSDVQVIQEHADIQPYQVHVGVVLGASACGSLVTSMSESGMISVNDCHLTGTFRQLTPSKRVIKTFDKPQNPWVGEPLDPHAEPSVAADAATEGSEEGADGPPLPTDKPVGQNKGAVWQLAQPAAYLYNGIWMGRTTIICVYPNGCIRTLKCRIPK